MTGTRKAIVLTGLAMIAGAIALVGTSRAQTKYALVCRGPNTAIFGANQNSGRTISMPFQRGSSPNEPLRGQCVWADRAFGAGEPNCIIVSNIAFTVTKRNDTWTWESELHTSNPDAIAIVNGLGTEDWTHTFMVYNPLNGTCLKTQ